MATGACGINCTTCRLHLRGECSSCGPATSQLADLKLQTQERLLGSPCPLLACARFNRLDHCMADCDNFPCENFENGPYPFSSGFLNMQRRRREEMDRRKAHHTETAVADEHWQALTVKDRRAAEQNGLVAWKDTDVVELEVLGRRARILVNERRVEWRVGSEDWLVAPSMVAIVAVMYVLTADGQPLSGKWVTEKDLSSASFFKGMYALPIGPLTDRFGNSSMAFITSGERLGATQTDDSGDAAMLFWVLPRVPVKMILWCRDEELPAALTVLFDKSIEHYLPSDAIWAVVRLLQEGLLGQWGEDKH